MTSFGFIGWCKEDIHDKVWGYFYRPTPNKAHRDYGGNCCIFWGRRGKAMQFKPDVTGYELEKLVNSKRKKGYVEITDAKLYQIWPSFTEEMELKLCVELLAGRVK